MPHVSKPGAVERQRLEDGLQAIRSLLESRGFAYSAGSEAESSGGPFATSMFRRGPLEIGFIVRNGGALASGEGLERSASSRLVRGSSSP